MYGEEVAILGIIFGSIITIVFIGVLGGIIKAAINRKSGDITENKEFLAALREFKEKTDRRISNLEAIVSEEKPDQSRASKSFEPKKESSKSIEIELSEEEEKNKGDSGKLRNMLNQ